MSDEKDRLGEKLQKKERAEEDRFFEARERELIDKLKHDRGAAAADDLRRLAQDRCPRCGEQLRGVQHDGVSVDQCPSGHGMWLDAGEFETLARRERDSWLGRFFSALKPHV
jgi:hypothetical protein